LAQKLGLDILKTWCPRTPKDLAAIDADFPLGIKPAVKEDFFYATKAKAWRANNREKLTSLWKEATVHSGFNEVLVQEIIPGDGSCQFSSLTELAARFLKEINYYGLAEIEFKRDPRDGKYKLLDVNARTWGFHVLGFAAGVDFPYLLYADQMGHSFKPLRGRVGVGWIRMVTDIPSCLLGFVGGYLGWQDYKRSVQNFEVESVFSKEDLLPSLVELALLPYLAFKRGF
jgi:predicted ATP-grasp superfamily ATP-dependent carboligase